MLKAVAIDDEPLALKITETFCEKAGVCLEKTFTGPGEGLKYINKFAVNMVFLDIQMPGINGLELARQLRPDVLVIFTTAYDDFALEGYNLNAIDYLLKPFTYERFLTAVQKAQRFYQGALKGENNPSRYLTVRADYSLVKIPLDAIELIEGLDDYVKIHVKEAKAVVVRSTMKSILDLLPDGEFFRIHRSFIVPVKDIVSMRSKSIYLKSKEIPIGQSYIQTLTEWFNKKSD